MRPVRTSSGGFLDAKGVKYTRAVPMSAATLTAVIVTLPTRGSFTSRAMTSERTRWISDSIRLFRCASAIQLTTFRLLESPRDFHAREALDLVAYTHVLVVLHANTAFGAGTNLPRF